MDKYEYWLAALPVADRKKTLLRSYMKSAEEVYYIEETTLRRFQFLNEKDCNTMIQAKKNMGLAGRVHQPHKKADPVCDLSGSGISEEAGGYSGQTLRPVYKRKPSG